ncbi:unnamed protein product [Toxocara canis]|uniref:Uncharacterized protein n=1 Tax=Toxocara canis TaxID=6265 RepID=A0A3P7H1I5_TOXCA|nr:unnamed protein product [Toxocara canis]
MLFVIAIASMVAPIVSGQAIALDDADSEGVEDVDRDFLHHPWDSTRTKGDSVQDEQVEYIYLDFKDLINDEYGDELKKKGSNTDPDYNIETEDEKMAYTDRLKRRGNTKVSEARSV